MHQLLSVVSIHQSVYPLVRHVTTLQYPVIAYHRIQAVCIEVKCLILTLMEIEDRSGAKAVYILTVRAEFLHIGLRLKVPPNKDVFLHRSWNEVWNRIVQMKNRHLFTPRHPMTCTSMTGNTQKLHQYHRQGEEGIQSLL